MNSIVNATRLGNFQLFGRGVKPNERSANAEIGIVTYDDDGHYEITSYTLGFRADHLGNAVARALGDDQPCESIDSPLAGDSELLLDNNTRYAFRRDGVNVDRKAEREERKATRDEIKRMNAERSQPVSLAEAAA